MVGEVIGKRSMKNFLEGKNCSIFYLVGYMSYLLIKTYELDYMLKIYAFYCT